MGEASVHIGNFRMDFGMLKGLSCQGATSRSLAHLERVSPTQKAATWVDKQ